MSILTITPYDNGDTLPLYNACQGQVGTAYLCLDTRDGEVSVVGVHPWTNSVPMDVFHGHVRTYEIPANLTAEGIEQLLSDKTVVACLESIYDDADTRWDGSNHRTNLTTIGEEAEALLVRYLETDSDSFSQLEPATAAWWLCDGYANNVLPGEDHETAAARHADEALADGFYIDQGELERALDIMKAEADEAKEDAE